MGKIKEIINGLKGKTGIGLLTLALSAVLSKNDVSGADIAAGIGAAQVLIGMIHKVIKVKAKKQG